MIDVPMNVDIDIHLLSDVHGGQKKWPINALTAVQSWQHLDCYPNMHDIDQMIPYVMVD